MSSLSGDTSNISQKSSITCKKDNCNGTVEKQVKGVSATGFAFSLPRCTVCGVTYSATEFSTVPTKGVEEFEKILNTHYGLL